MGEHARRTEGESVPAVGLIRNPDPGGAVRDE
jgi:hypothetical protein